MKHIFYICTALCLVVTILMLSYIPNAVDAAQVTIDNSVSITATFHTATSPRTVFTSDLVGYRFFLQSTSPCAYRKTTDGGASWGARVTIDDQAGADSCLGVVVWYDRWTPNDFGNYIHVATFDATDDDVFYNRIDTANSDQRLTGTTAINASSNSGQVATLTGGANAISITKGTDGTIYIATNDASDSFVVECSSTCETTTNWTETGTNPQDAANDYTTLLPLVNGNIMLINRDVSADDLRSKIWNNTAGAWDTSWATIDSSAPEATANMAATVASSTVAATTTIFLAYIADNVTPGTDDDIRTAIYSGSGWNAGTADVLTNDSKGITSVAIGRNSSSSDVFVAYGARTTAADAATTNIYWKSASSTMASWNAESAALNTSAGTYPHIDANIASEERIYASWFDDTADDILGNTLIDFPSSAPPPSSTPSKAQAEFFF